MNERKQSEREETMIERERVVSFFCFSLLFFSHCFRKSRTTIRENAPSSTNIPLQNLFSHF